jgi:N-acetylglucosamine kinase-like BadF-type ATPase
MSACYLGVDGGGTRTQAVIVDEAGNVRGIGAAGASNFGNTSVELAQQNIGGAVHMAAAEAGLATPTFNAAFLGIAGVVSESDRDVVRQMAQQLRLAPSDKIGADHDCRIALAGGLAGAPGIVQIIGTGTSCFGMNTQGERWMSGGWGHLIADEGGGYWLGIQAIKAAAAAYDGRGEVTLLHDAVLHALGIDGIPQIMERLYTAKIAVSEIAALSRVVVAAAQEQDSVAQAIIAIGMDEVARCVVAVSHRVKLGDAPSLVCVGGMIQAGSIIATPLAEAVYRRLPNCQIVQPRFPAAVGAALLARQMCAPLDDPFLMSLKTSLGQRQ